VVNIADAWEDKRFDNSFDLKTGFRTRSMLVVPIMSRRMELLGCCQLINKGQEGDVFNQSDINFVQVFCAQASLGIENSFENLRQGKHLQCVPPPSPPPCIYVAFYTPLPAAFM